MRCDLRLVGVALALRPSRCKQRSYMICTSGPQTTIAALALRPSRCKQRSYMPCTSDPQTTIAASAPLLHDLYEWSPDHDRGVGAAPTGTAHISP